MKQRQIDFYIGLEAADRARRARDFQQSDGIMPMTMGWTRYRPHESPVRVLDGYGRQRWLTPTQHRVYTVARSHEGELISATTIANSIGVATSTVTRALLRLAALRLVAYDSIRGRNGGISILQRSWADLRARATTAWGKLRMERDKAWDRYLRKLDRSHYFSLELNVATSTPEGRNIYGSP